MSTPGGLDDERVLLTGASGFIGSHLCRQLIAAGAQVHAVSRREQPPSESIRWWQADLSDPDTVHRLMVAARPRVVFHLASHVQGARELDHVRPAFLHNLASTVYLLEEATRLGCRRFIQTGSLEEPGPDDPLDTPSSPYAAAKLGATAYGRMFHALYGTPFVSARVFMVYGPAQRDLTKLVPYLIQKLLAGEEVKLGAGTRPVDWIYVEDVAEGLVRTALIPGLEGKRVDLGSGRLRPIRDVVAELFRQLTPHREPPFGTLPERPLEQVRAADVETTKRLLGWHPETGLEEGLRRTIAWYRLALGADATGGSS